MVVMELISKLRKSFFDFSVSTYDFSTLCTILPHTLIQENFTELISRTFNTDCVFYLACNENRVFFSTTKNIVCGHVRKFVTLSTIFG